MVQDIHSAIILESCLRHQSRITKTPFDLKYSQGILNSLASFIRPSGNFINLDEHAEGEKVNRGFKLPNFAIGAAKTPALERLTFTAETVLRAILRLHAQPDFWEVNIDPTLLLSLLAYVDGRDPWASEATQKLALELLSKHQAQLVANSFIIDYVLLGFVRPLFSDSKPPTVTSQGRKALNSAPKNHRISSEDPSNKPWKFRDVYATTVFKWTVANADVRSDQLSPTIR
jgi:Tti2 family